ncbi:hypothetical protein INP57_25700 [Saccharopolyspora sp. HNM0986]|uniref:hypothetical protein n=1 Tax=Saccharopolyspora galaxeae TaxID=2781241 RepID=UPI00190B4800|nr:hypothetical protein [Saccharopolyspora sp. HNM0986]MBK0870210.1 hypothetical protein [Saccharopolyspora sp. HNM0986]
MAITAVISALGAPGVSTTVAALATAWPGPLLAADADPVRGALVPGWLSRWWVDGRLTTETGVVTFAASTRRMTTVPAEGLAGHVHAVPHARHIRVLPGVLHAEQAIAIGSDGWSRLASALRDVTKSGPDVLVDAGRWCPQTPWPLLNAADRVLLAVRPSLRSCSGSTDLARYLTDRYQRVELAVLAADSRQAADTAQALGVPVGFSLPEDAPSARVFSDGAEQPKHLHRRPLWKAIRSTARGLHRQAHVTVRFCRDSTRAGVGE